MSERAKYIPARTSIPYRAVGNTSSSGTQAGNSNHGNWDCASLESLWVSQGGNPAYKFIAAEIARAESGGNQYAHSPTDDIGLWQINAPSWGSMASYNPYVNARSAITISHNGTDWNPWTTYRIGAYNGRC